MPKVVDHSQRRAEIIEALLVLIAEQGISAVTSRTLADHLGVSNGALWRYFAGKDELLTAAYRTVVEHTNRRASAEMAGHSGVAQVEALVDSLLPLNATSKLEARVVVSFWGLAATNPAGSPGRPEVEEWGRLVDGLLRSAVTSGDLRLDTPTGVLTTMLLSYVTNAQLEYVFRGDSVTAGMARPIHDLLDAFRA